MLHVIFRDADLFRKTEGYHGHDQAIEEDVGENGEADNKDDEHG